VSVVLPTFNRADTVGRAIRSVLDQTFTDLELIVVDDGSTDDTVAVLARFADPRLRVLRSTVNRGVSAARNKGIEEARGRFIAFEDSDDSWRPQKLQRQIDCLASAGEGVAVVGCGWQLHEARRTETTRPRLRGRPRGGEMRRAPYRLPLLPLSRHRRSRGPADAAGRRPRTAARAERPSDEQPSLIEIEPVSPP